MKLNKLYLLSKQKANLCHYEGSENQHKAEFADQNCNSEGYESYYFCIMNGIF